MEPLTIAKNLIRVYVKRGDTERDLNLSQLGAGCSEWSARIHRNKIIVYKVNGEEVDKSFPLNQIYQLVKNEQIQLSLF